MNINCRHGAANNAATARMTLRTLDFVAVR
jgi:hypothetical protein